MKEIIMGSKTISGKVDVDIDYGGTDIMIGDTDLIKELLYNYDGKEVTITIEVR
jgi:hypothetical protein